MEAKIPTHDSRKSPHRLGSPSSLSLSVQASDIEDADLGVRHATAVAGLGVGLVLVVAVALRRSSTHERRSVVWPGFGAALGRGRWVEHRETAGSERK